MKFDEKMFYENDSRKKIEYESEKIVVKIIFELTKFRNKNNISQELLSKTTGLSQKVISNIENLKVSPQIDILCKIYCGLKELVKHQ